MPCVPIIHAKRLLRSPALPKKPARPNPHSPKEESNASIASTVFWMLCVICAVVAEFVAIVTGIVLGQSDIAVIPLVHGIAVLLGLVTSLTGVALIPVVLRVREDRPPPSAIWLSLGAFAGALALGFLFR